MIDHRGEPSRVHGASPYPAQTWEGSGEGRAIAQRLDFPCRDAAQELRLQPAVAALPGITARVKDGQMVTVDGRTGRLILD